MVIHLLRRRLKFQTPIRKLLLHEGDSRGGGKRRKKRRRTEDRERERERERERGREREPYTFAARHFRYCFYIGFSFSVAARERSLISAPLAERRRKGLDAGLVWCSIWKDTKECAPWEMGMPTCARELTKYRSAKTRRVGTSRRAQLILKTRARRSSRSTNLSIAR